MLWIDCDISHKLRMLYLHVPLIPIPSIFWNDPPLIHGRAADGADQYCIWLSANRLDQNLIKIAFSIGQLRTDRAGGVGDLIEPWID